MSIVVARAASTAQAHLRCPEIKTVGTKHKINEKAWRKTLDYGQELVSHLRLTRTGHKMFQWTEANVSCSNLSVVVACEHADSASSSTHLQLMGRKEVLGEPGKNNPDTLDLWCSRTRGLGPHHLRPHPQKFQH
jgi:hypothetical protein